MHYRLQGQSCLPGAELAAAGCASGDSVPSRCVCQLKRPSLADCFRACETQVASLLRWYCNSTTLYGLWLNNLQHYYCPLQVAR